MSKGQLSRLRGSIEAQLRWAVAYGGDRELLDLLRSERERLSAQLMPSGDRLQFGEHPDREAVRH
jgi:hypothetical protein